MTEPDHAAPLEAQIDQWRTYLRRRQAINAVDDTAGQVAFERPALALPGRPVFEEMVKWLETLRDKGLLMPHDVNVGTEMARIVTGGDVSSGIDSRTHTKLREDVDIASVELETLAQFKREV